MKFKVKPIDHGKRLDVYLAGLIPEVSRSQIQKWTREGRILVNEKPSKSGVKLKESDRIEVNPPPKTAPADIRPEQIDLDIIFEDTYLLIVNKPPGMVVHPAPGNPHHTLVNALIHHFNSLSSVAGCDRPGIVHRLDKGTSGAMLVARENRTHRLLTGDFKSHRIKKEYIAVIYGVPPESKGVVDLPVGRHPRDRKRMSVRRSGGREAVTHWELIDTSEGLSLVKIDLLTGRTHQIRVHLKTLGYPVVGDVVYGRSRYMEKIRPEWLKDTVKDLSHPLLHSYKIGFTHPVYGDYREYVAKMPQNMSDLIETLFDWEGG